MSEENDNNELAINTRDLNLWYGDFQALFDVNLDIKQGIITSMIGPSGCGKSTFLRSVNRINERLGYVRIQGAINVLDHNIYSPEVELVQVRKQIGMVFQRPNPLPLSIRLGQGQGQVECQGNRAFPGGTAKALYCAPAAGQAGCSFDGRTLFST